MFVLKILWLFLLILRHGGLSQNPNNLDNDYYYSMEQTLEETTTIKNVLETINATHVLSSNLSGNIELTSLQILTTNTPLTDKTNDYDSTSTTVPELISETTFFDDLTSTITENIQNEDQTKQFIPTDTENSHYLLTEDTTKAPTDGTKSLPVDLRSSTSGVLEELFDRTTTEKVVIVTPWRNGVTVDDGSSSENVIIVTNSYPTTTDNFEDYTFEQNFSDVNSTADFDDIFVTSEKDERLFAEEQGFVTLSFKEINAETPKLGEKDLFPSVVSSEEDKETENSGNEVTTEFGTTILIPQTSDDVTEILSPEEEQETDTITETTLENFGNEITTEFGTPTSIPLISEGTATNTETTLEDSGNEMTTEFETTTSLIPPIFRTLQDLSEIILVTTDRISTLTTTESNNWVTTDEGLTAEEINSETEYGDLVAEESQTLEANEVYESTRTTRTSPEVITAGESLQTEILSTDSSTLDYDFQSTLNPVLHTSTTLELYSQLSTILDDKTTENAGDLLLETETEKNISTDEPQLEVTEAENDLKLNFFNYLGGRRASKQFDLINEQSGEIEETPATTTEIEPTTTAVTEIILESDEVISESFSTSTENSVSSTIAVNTDKVTQETITNGLNSFETETEIITSYSTKSVTTTDLPTDKVYAEENLLSTTLLPKIETEIFRNDEIGITTTETTEWLNTTVTQIRNETPKELTTTTDFLVTSILVTSSFEDKSQDDSKLDLLSETTKNLTPQTLYILDMEKELASSDLEVDLSSELEDISEIVAKICDKEVRFSVRIAGKKYNSKYRSTSSNPKVIFVPCGKSVTITWRSINKLCPNMILVRLDPLNPIPYVAYKIYGRREPTMYHYGRIDDYSVAASRWTANHSTFNIVIDNWKKLRPLEAIPEKTIALQESKLSDKPVLLGSISMAILILFSMGFVIYKSYKDNQWYKIWWSNLCFPSDPRRASVV